MSADFMMNPAAVASVTEPGAVATGYTIFSYLTNNRSLPLPVL